MNPNPREVSMTETESMQLITLMINKAKNRFSETGILYMIWGWLVLVCCLVQFIALHFYNNQNAYYIWYVTWLAPVFQIIYSRIKKKSRTVRTYTDEIIGFVWLVFVICLTLQVFILIYLKAYTGICPAVLVMYGMPTFLSGVIVKFKPLITGGIFCWLLAAVSILLIYDFQLLVIALAVVVAWIIPGYLLKQKLKTGELK